MSLTSVQEKAVFAKGNVLLMAGAGTGKTRTLVERCLNSLLDATPPGDISEILVVTFTEAAAAEMRHRLRDRLQERADASLRETRAAQQLALFETAHIGTLHSFCLDLARRHFYLLELDPQFSVMSEEESRMLASEQLDALFTDMYSAKTPLAQAARELIGTHGDGSDKSIRALVRRLHDYAQTLPDPEGWKRQQIQIFSDKEPALWREWLSSGIAEFKQQSASFLQELSDTNDIAKQCLSVVMKLSAGDLSGACSLLSTVRSARNECPKGKKGAWVEPLKEFFGDAQFLCSILPRADRKDPLLEDWSWVSGQMRALIELSTEFTERFSKAKRDLALADFHDLEQFALQLLWDNEAKVPTSIAQHWRKNFRHVLVDEYQDINAAQDQILQALSHDGKNGNRFLVGDLKQSIYRFRLAAPRIFQSYMREWRKDSGTVIPLNENFRSREGVLDFINSVFEMLMIEPVGGIVYDEDARLRFGAPKERKQLSNRGTEPAHCKPRVEIHIRLKGKANNENGEFGPESDSITELEEAAKEARLVALQLRRLRDAKHLIWDEELDQFRPVEWRDMAILLRSRSGKTEFYAREFARLQVPLAVARGDFFESTEISDTMSLLTILDNPLQDLPVLAVLRSPLVALSLEELAEIRLTAEGPFWVALARWHERCSSRREEALSIPHSAFPPPHLSEPPHVGCYMEDAQSVLAGKVRRFMERHSRWRTYARQMSLSACLEEILAETRYAEWLLTQSRGQERFANLQGLINLARKFDRFQKQGLLRFLLFVESQKSAEAEPPVPTVTDENAVRLMSIHQSKGLEFPVVALVDTAKNFNLQDLKADIILDEVYGICPMIKPPKSSKRYPSLPYWLGRKRQRTELLGEELRLLYVAMTRARDTLLITGSLSEKQINAIWAEPASAIEREIASARCFMDWLGLWLAHNAGRKDPECSSGECALARWTIHDASALSAAAEAADGKTQPLPEFLSDSSRLREIETKLSWKYPFNDAVRQPAKAAVSALRRAALAEEEDVAAPFQFRTPAARIPAAKALDAGTVTHAFMQAVSLQSVCTEAALRAEAERMVGAGLLPETDVALIDFQKVAAFWTSSLGKAVLAKGVEVHRELPFTAKFRAKEVSELIGTPASALESDEFIVVQGVADLVLISAGGMQIIDFKTDNVSGRALEERARQYEMQLRLYALALGRIYKRQVAACWLYFLSAGKAVEVKLPGPPAPTSD